MSFNSAPGKDDSLSLETNKQVVDRLGTIENMPKPTEDELAAMYNVSPIKSAEYLVPGDEMTEVVTTEPLHNAHVEAQSEHLRQESIQKDEELAEQKKKERIAAEAKIGTIFSARVEKGAVKYVPGRGQIELTPLAMKSIMVNKILELYKQSTMGEGQDLNGWTKYVEAIKNQANLILDEKERNAILKLVQSGASTGGELPAFIKGEFTKEQYNAVLKSGIDRGMTEAKAKTRADTMSLNREQQVQAAKELLAQIDPDLEYNM